MIVVCHFVTVCIAIISVKIAIPPVILLMIYQKSFNNCYDYYFNAIYNHKTTSNHQLCDINLNKKPRLRSCDIGYSGVTIKHEGNVFFLKQQWTKSQLAI